MARWRDVRAPSSVACHPPQRGREIPREPAPGRTLADLSAQTGVSVSTLSRLESGDRKPTLELLLPLARAYGVTLDELVDAPPTGDPRVHLRPVLRHGMTMIPLTQRAGGIQAVGLEADDQLMAVEKTDGQREVMIATKQGMIIRFAEEEVRPMGRGAGGVLQRGHQLTQLPLQRGVRVGRVVCGAVTQPVLDRRD